MKIINFFILFLFVNITFSQTETLNAGFVEYSKDFKFNDGIFLNFGQVKNNNPVPKSRIVSIYDSNDFDFFENTLDKETVFFYDETGVKQEVKVSNFWGYSQNGVLYINWNDDFSRIVVVGGICHFVANKVVNNYSYNPYNSYYYDPYSSNSSSVELRQYLLHFDTGTIYDYTYKNLEIILMHDPELYDEYHNLSKKKRKKLKFVYIRKFNKQNPIFIKK